MKSVDLWAEKQLYGYEFMDVIGSKFVPGLGLEIYKFIRQIF